MHFTVRNSKIPRKIKNDDLVNKRRKQIITAGIKLFAEKGFYETNMRELATEAGISQGNIYDYVGNKQDIFFLIHEYINTIATDMTNKAIKSAGNDPLKKLYQVIRAELDLMYENSDTILLMYRESYILDRSHLKALLKNERARVAIFEQVLIECASKNLLKDVNIRVAANLIKAMAETVVVKRWDLKGAARYSEVWNTIDTFIKGLLKDASTQRQFSANDLSGKSVLIINRGTILGQELALFLTSKNEAKVALYINSDQRSESEHLISQLEQTKKAKVYLSKDVGPINPKLLTSIACDLGPIEIVIHDLGIAESNLSKNTGAQSVHSPFEANLEDAYELVEYIEETMIKEGLEKILYLAPWAWTRQINPLQYDTTKVAIVELTKRLSKRLAAYKVNVNCVIPGFIGGDIGSTEQRSQEHKGILGNIPLGYLGEPTDVLDAISFLISDKSRYVTGDAISVSGGF